MGLELGLEWDLIPFVLNSNSACFAQPAALLGVVWDLGAVVVIRIAVC